jgi:large subunit ribosomal protein L22
MAERKKATSKPAKRETEGKRESEAKSGAKGRPAKSAATKSAAGSAAAKAEEKGTTKAKSSPAKAKPKTQAKAKAEGKPKAPTKPKAEAKPKARAKPKEATKRPVVRARARFVRVAPRKARLVASQVRGMHVDDARTLLRFSSRGAARDIVKVIDSAAANAEANHELVADDLRVADITVDEGPTLRRYRPRALGRATRINKRTSHIQVALTPGD